MPFTRPGREVGRELGELARLKGEVVSDDEAHGGAVVDEHPIGGEDGTADKRQAADLRQTIGVERAVVGIDTRLPRQPTSRA